MASGISGGSVRSVRDVGTRTGRLRGASRGRARRHRQSGASSPRSCAPPPQPVIDRGIVAAAAEHHAYDAAAAAGAGGSLVHCGVARAQASKPACPSLRLAIRCFPSSSAPKTSHQRLEWPDTSNQGIDQGTPRARRAARSATVVPLPTYEPNGGQHEQCRRE
jgi:hypothetical protein